MIVTYYLEYMILWQKVKLDPKILSFLWQTFKIARASLFFYFYLVATYLSLETVIINPSGTIKFKHLSTGLLTKNRHYWSIFRSLGSVRNSAESLKHFFVWLQVNDKGSWIQGVLRQYWYDLSVNVASSYNPLKAATDLKKDAVDT